MKKVAVVLAGCGSADGSEINETVTLLLALNQHNIEYQAFAPDAFSGRGLQSRHWEACQRASKYDG